MTGFTIVGEITSVQTIAEGPGIRELPRLVKVYGAGHWRKRKGIATIELTSGRIRRAEVHWYEAHGIGKKEQKLKQILD